MGAAARSLAEARYGLERHGELIGKVYRMVAEAWDTRQTGGLGDRQLAAAGAGGGATE